MRNALLWLTAGVLVAGCAAFGVSSLSTSDGAAGPPVGGTGELTVWVVDAKGVG